MNFPTPSLRPYFATCAAIFGPLFLVLVAVGYRYGFPVEKSGGETGVAQELSMDFQRLADRMLPSVVRVHTSVEKEFKRVVLDAAGNAQPEADAEFDTMPGIGSGVIVSADGLILTNWHVIKDLDLKGGRDTLFVALHRETELRQVDIIGVDAVTDVVVLKLQGKLDRALPPLAFGDSDQMHRGNIVMALGSPFGLWDTVTQGILSNCERRLGDSDAGQQYLQTDCVINPGNSGGPLVNLKGEIIGINWAVYSGQQDVHTWQGVGLAIRSNDAKAAMDKILNNSGPRSYVGIMLDEQLDPAKGKRKVWISGVVNGSPAYAAGLRQGDVVQEIDGHEMADATEVWKWVQSRKVGERIKFLVKRANQPQPLMEVQVVSADEAAPVPPQIVDLGTEIGLRVQNGSAKEAVSFQARGWRWGAAFVVVREVAADSPLAAKVRPGDLLAAAGVGGEAPRRLNNSEELQKLLPAWRADTALSLSFWRDPQMQFDHTFHH